LAPPNLSLTDDELVICGRDGLRGLRGLTKPVEKSVDHDVHQNPVGIGTLKEFKEIMAKIYLPSTTLRAWAAERVQQSQLTLPTHVSIHIHARM
jgi:hypothetical protein